MLFLLHDSVIYDHHQAFINNKNTSTFITGLRVGMGPLLIVLSCKRFYVGFMFKYVEILV
jgi:hypothetical protein